VFVISEFSLIWTTDYCIWSLFSILKFYACDTFVISTKRCEKPSDNTSTVDRDAWYYMRRRFRISAAYQLILTLNKIFQIFIMVRKFLQIYKKNYQIQIFTIQVHTVVHGRSWCLVLYVRTVQDICSVSTYSYICEISKSN
jgi:hypothetical protein